MRSPTDTTTAAEPSAGSPVELGAETDAGLAQRARAGDRGAFAELYERYLPTVHGILLSGAPVQEARDLVQDVFLLALRAIGRLEQADRFGPWLCSIARNCVHELHRAAHKNAESLSTLDPGHEPHVEPPADAESADEAAHVLRAIQELPESYRETLTLRLVEGLSGPQIAERCGLTHGSLRVNLHRGMKLLRERLEDHGASA